MQYLPISSEINEDQFWEMVPSTSMGEERFFEIDKIKHDMGYGFTFGIENYSLESFKIVLDYSYFKIDSKRIYKISKIEMDFQSEYHALLIGINYMFKRTIGLRPFSGLGLKHLVLTKEEEVFSENVFDWQSFYLEEDKSTVTQIVLIFGL